jgi:pimeloyl-ACP methyl ester carboxylesterase
MDDRPMDVVLVAHGWLGYPGQFRGLIAHLCANGFDARAVGYRTVFGRFDTAVAAARSAARAAEPAPLHLIGFSLGGLVMRALASESPPGLRSLLLIATPNAGTPLADIGRRFMPTPALRRLSTDAPAIGPVPPHVRVGCIAATRSDLLGRLIKGENDGRVPVASALAIPHDSACRTPQRHTAIPFAPETAELALRFLRTGGFEGGAVRRCPGWPARTSRRCEESNNWCER